jgi:molecular chaperone DnaK (HSP70)
MNLTLVGFLQLCFVVYVAWLCSFIGELRKEITIGIDLGTTFSAAAVCVDGQIHIIDHDGKPGLVPSYVYFGPDGKKLVGQSAKDLAHLHPLDTVFAVKRIIGRTFDDPVVKQELSSFPFSVVPSSDDPALPLIMAPHDNPKPYFPQNISAIVLKTLKTNVEQHFKWRRLLGWRVSSVTISIPSNFGSRKTNVNFNKLR